MNEQLKEIINSMKTVRVLCVGDIMLDIFVHGTVNRISPEAPVPILKYDNKVKTLGGVGNVALGLNRLGCDVALVSVIGRDGSGEDIIELLSKETGITSEIVWDRSRTTTTKTRFTQGTQHIMRFDEESTEKLSYLIEKQIIANIQSFSGQIDVLVVSDYCKGVLTEKIIECLCNLECPLKILDSKAKNIERYSGDFDLFTPNESEFAKWLDLDIQQVITNPLNAIPKIKNKFKKGILLTRSQRGMMFIPTNDDAIVIAQDSDAQQVIDVSGAGDTVVCIIAASLAVKNDLDAAVRLSSFGSGWVVGQPGTSVITNDQLIQIVSNTDLKIMNEAQALNMSERWHNADLEVGFINGCFDILHAGHLNIIKQAAKKCDRLIIAINSDASITRLKGPERPIQRFIDRARALSRIEGVDLIVRFDTNHPGHLIELLCPSIIFKSSEYQEQDFPELSSIKMISSQIEFIPRLQGISTTDLVSE